MATFCGSGAGSTEMPPGSTAGRASKQEGPAAGATAGHRARPAPEVADIFLDHGAAPRMAIEKR
jgi:hypothetical protein